MEVGFSEHTRALCIPAIKASSREDAMRVIFDLNRFPSASIAQIFTSNVLRPAESKVSSHIIISVMSFYYKLQMIQSIIFVPYDDTLVHSLALYNFQCIL